MGKLRNYILAPEGKLDEMTYEGNIGFEEMVKFYQKANDDQIEKMEEIIKKDDWESFKKLIRKVTGTKLK